MLCLWLLLGIVTVSSGVYVNTTDVILRYGPNMRRLIVYVWFPQGEFAGHASMELTDGSYFSNLKTSLQGDKDNTGKSPSLTFHAPNRLDENKMTALWNKWRSNGFPSNYTNCSIMYDLLREGGSPMVLTIYWRPETLRRYLQRWERGSFNFLNMPWFD